MSLNDTKLKLHYVPFFRSSEWGFGYRLCDHQKRYAGSIDERRRVSAICFHLPTLPFVVCSMLVISLSSNHSLSQSVQSTCQSASQSISGSINISVSQGGSNSVIFLLYSFQSDYSAV